MISPSLSTYLHINDTSATYEAHAEPRGEVILRLGNMLSGGVGVTVFMTPEQARGIAEKLLAVAPVAALSAKHKETAA